MTSSSSATVEHTGSSSFSVSREGDDAGEMREGRSFLEDRSKVTGFSDVLSRMGATEAVDPEAKVTSDDQARSLLNRFLGAQVLMSGVESMMASSSISESSKMTTDSTGATTVTKEASGHSASTAAKDGVVTDHKSSSFNTGPQTTTVSSSALASRKAQGEAVVVAGVNITEVTDDFKLNQLLDSCDEYEDRRKIRMRLKALVAEKKGLREELSGHDQSRGSRSQTSTAHSRFEAMSKSATSNTKDSDLRSSEGDSKTSTVSPFGVSRTSNTESRSSSQVNVQKSSYSSSSSSYKTSSSMSKVDSKKVVSPFDKFKQMDSQTPRTPKE